MNKACPIVIAKHNDQRRILVFKHPLEGVQLVKGGIKKGEKLEHACERELAEESGIQAKAVRCLGSWKPGFKKQEWGFCLMHFEGELPERWSFETKDDDGQIFDFFWHPMHLKPGSDWDPMYRDAFEHLKSIL